MSEKIKTKLSELKRHYDFEIINQKLSNKTIIVSSKTDHDKPKYF